MISSSLFYPYLYVLVANFLALLMIVYTNYSHSRLLNSFLFVVAVSLFFFGALRTSGPDLLTYRDFYYNSPHRIPDIFFSFLLSIFSFIGIKFEIFLLACMAITLISIKQISKAYQISFLFTFCIYFIYLIPLRDLAQFRLGLAISLLLIAFSNNKQKLFSWPLYCAAVLCHYTTIVLLFNIVGSYLIASIKGSYLKVILVIISVCLIFLVAVKIQTLAFMDPRIEIYLAYTGHMDGRPVQSRSILLYYILILISFVFFSGKEIVERDNLALAYMMIFTITIFIAFSNIAIFAFRLAHVAAALHPVMIAIVFNSIRKSKNPEKSKALGILIIAIIMIIHISKLSVDSMVYSLEFF